MTKTFRAAIALVAGLVAAPALAEVVGAPHPEQLGLQAPASPIADYGHWMHNDLVMPIITAITLFVLALLLYTMFRFRRSANPVPSTTTHNALVEVIWTAVPVLILVVIAFPSMRLLYAQARLPEAAAETIKVTGHQWYWNYDYVDRKISFDANLSKKEELTDQSKYLLATDNALVVPAGKTVKLLVTSEDVIHAWWIPSLFVQMDAVPGRINETWIKANKPGTYYGQCNQLCGINHGYMPIMVRALAPGDYAEWLAQAKTKFAMTDNGTTELAAANSAAPARN